MVPAALGLVFLAVLLGERAGVEGDLQVVAPPRARAGGTLPIRAFHFHRLERPEGPALSDVPADAVLVDADGRVLAQATLQPSATVGLEGNLAVPEHVTGRLQLRLSAALTPEQTSRVVAPVTVSADPEPADLAGRLSLPLQRFRVFPLRPEGEGPPPAHLEPRVSGGACVPELPCELWVLVGAPAAAVDIEPSASVTRASEPGPPTAGLARLTVVTHGPEAQTELIARRDGEIVARRRVQLPVALASARLSIGEGAATDRDRAAVLPVAPASLKLHVEALELERGVIVDAFRDGVWERTGSVGPGALEGYFALPFEPLGPGLWRVQARTDAFSADSAATRLVYVRREGQGEQAAFEELARRARRQWEDPLADEVSELARDPDAGAAFLLAAPELDLAPQPLAISGHMQQATGLDDRRVRIRWAGAIAVLLAGIVVAALVWRRGVAAGTQARAILTEAGEETAGSPRARRRMTLTVLAYSAAIALAFLAAAALLFARGG